VTIRSSSWLEPIAQAAQELFTAKDRLDELLMQSGIVHEPERMRAAQLATDTAFAALLFEEAHQARAEEWVAEEQQPGSLALHFTTGILIRKLVPAQRLILQLKALHFFLRAYQDAMYALLFELVIGKRAGNTRMQVIIKKEANPVGEKIRDKLPNYIEWFVSWREQRNRIKDGVSFATIGPATDLGIIAATFNEEGGYTLRPEGPAIRAGDIIEALRMSTHLADLASVLASEKL
jgi:hypothetical protein